MAVAKKITDDKAEMYIIFLTTEIWRKEGEKDVPFTNLYQALEKKIKWFLCVSLGC